MLISEQKKKENIAEYVIYMWQIEDLIRAYNFNPETIEKEIIANFDIDDEQYEKMKSWYDFLIQSMLNEKIEQKGHLQFLNDVVLELDVLHNKLLESEKNIEYKQEFENLMPFIEDLYSKITDFDKNFIEICFEALYGYLLLRLSKKNISIETQEAVSKISSFLSLLTKYYHKQE